MKNYRLTPVTNIGTNIPNEILTNFQWYVKYIIHHGQERLSPEIQNDLTLEICLIDHSSIIKETLHDFVFRKRFGEILNTLQSRNRQKLPYLDECLHPSHLN